MRFTGKVVMVLNDSLSIPNALKRERPNLIPTHAAGLDRPSTEKWVGKGAGEAAALWQPW
jgi:hypothetical protein